MGCVFCHSQELPRPLLTLLYCAHYFIKQNAGLMPMQMGIIWWLTSCIYNAWRKPSPPLFHAWLNELAHCLSFLLLFSIRFWSQCSDTCPEKRWGRKRQADHKCRKIGDIQSTSCPVTSLCRWVSLTLQLFFKRAQLYRDAQKYLNHMCNFVNLWNSRGPD